MPDPGNPPQTLCVQYNNVSAYDGVTLSVPYSRRIVSPNDEGIYEVDQAGGLGLIDPDGGDGGGSMGDRFIQWIEVVVDVATTITLDVVDGQDTTLVLTTVVPPTAVDAVLFRGASFRVPQGALLRVRSTGGTGGRLRMRPALEADAAADAANGGSVLAEYASVGYTTPGAAVEQAGSEAGFVDIVGASTLAAPSPGFASDADNQLTYLGSGGTFLVRAYLATEAQDDSIVLNQLRLRQNGATVPDSTMAIPRLTADGAMMVTQAEVTLAEGDVLSAQINNDNGTLALLAYGFQMTAQRVSSG